MFFIKYLGRFDFPVTGLSLKIGKNKTALKILWFTVLSEKNYTLTVYLMYICVIIAAEIAAEIDKDESQSVGNVASVKHTRERNYMGMLEYRKEDEQALIKNLIMGEFTFVVKNLNMGEFTSVIKNLNMGEFTSVVKNLIIGEFISVVKNLVMGEFTSVVKNLITVEFMSVVNNLIMGEFTFVVKNLVMGEFTSVVKKN